MTKHTPGPWQVWPTHWAGGSNSVRIDGRNTVWIDSPRGEIARIKPNGGRIDELVYADACLIAAAPDLLEALKDALRCVEYVDEHEGCPITLRKVRAAIAKAQWGHEGSHP